MTLKPCIKCGDLSEQGRCPDHRKDTRIRRDRGQAAYDRTWRSLSRRARQAQPWCTDCRKPADTTDHIIPKSIAPELVHAIENCAPRCTSCNSRRGTTAYTVQEALTVLDRLLATQHKHPTKKGKERIRAAQRVIHDQGGHPHETDRHPDGKAKFQSEVAL